MKTNHDIFIENLRGHFSSEALSLVELLFRSHLTNIFKNLSEKYIKVKANTNANTQVKNINNASTRDSFKITIQFSVFAFLHVSPKEAYP
jgi:hypothetical protein